LLFLRVIKLEKKQYILFAPFRRRKQVPFLQLMEKKTVRVVLAIVSTVILKHIAKNKLWKMGACRGKNVYWSKLNLQEQLQLSIMGFVSYILQLSNLQIMNTYYSYPMMKNQQLEEKLITRKQA
jgi:hypothetical protein